MTEMVQYAPKTTVATVTISSGQTKSNALKLYGTTPVVVEMPAAITGTSLSFEGSIDGGTTFTPINTSTGALTYTVAASNCYVLNPANFCGFDEVKLVMASQGADRTIKIKPYIV